MFPSSFIIFFIHHFFHATPRMISSPKVSAETNLPTTLCKSVRYYTAAMTANAQQSCFARRGTSQERDFCNALKFWGLTRAARRGRCDPYPVGRRRRRTVNAATDTRTVQEQATKARIKPCNKILLFEKEIFCEYFALPLCDRSVCCMPFLAIAHTIQTTILYRLHLAMLNCLTILTPGCHPKK